MPRSVHGYTCFACGVSDICGDCIPLYCPTCERKIMECHGGKLPRIFDPNQEPPHPDCPCSECKVKRSNESIKRKLAAEGIAYPDA